MTLVVLLGWWHAVEAHVQKYTEIYDELGVKSYVYIAPPRALILGNVHRNEVATAEWTKIKSFAQNQGCSSIIFHSFSNHGTNMFNAFWKVYQGDVKHGKCNLKIKGTIFDSAPGDLNITVGIKSIFEAKLPESLKYLVLAPILPLLMRFYYARNPTKYVILYLLGYHFVKRIINQEYLSQFSEGTLRLHHINPAFKTLFIYSKSDPLVSYSVIEKVARKLEAQGGRIVQKRFEDSRHCAHYLTYPEEYKLHIKKFLETIS